MLSTKSVKVSLDKQKKQQRKIIESQNSLFKILNNQDNSKNLSLQLNNDKDKSSIEDDNLNYNKNKEQIRKNTDLTSKFISRPCYFSAVQCLLNVSNKKIFNIVKLLQLKNSNNKKNNTSTVAVVATVAAAIMNAKTYLKKKNNSFFMLRHLGQQYRRHIFPKPIKELVLSKFF